MWRNITWIYFRISNVKNNDLVRQEVTSNIVQECGLENTLIACNLYSTPSEVKTVQAELFSQNITGYLSDFTNDKLEMNYNEDSKREPEEIKRANQSDSSDLSGLAAATTLTYMMIR